MKQGVEFGEKMLLYILCLYWHTFLCIYEAASSVLSIIQTMFPKMSNPTPAV